MMSVLRYSGVFVFVAAVLPVVHVAGSICLLADDAPCWPRFHGPDGQNISTDTGLLRAWPEGGPPLVWKAEKIGGGYASVTLANGLIYTAGNIEGKTVITALNLDGQILWQVPNGDAWTKDFAGARGTPTIDNGRLYHESPLGQIVCLDGTSGTKIWDLNILGKFNADNATWALAESLLIDGDHVICCPGGPETTMVALDKKTGETVWTSPGVGDKAGYATPTLAVYQGRRIILTLTARALIGVDADNGDLLWRHEHLTKYDINVMQPLYHDGKVFISTGYGAGSALLKIMDNGRRVWVEKVWQSHELDNLHGGVVLLDGCIYGAAHNAHKGKWVCLNWDSGIKQYAESGVGMGSLTCADGLLYTLSENAQMGLVKATPQGFALISQFRLPVHAEGPSWAHPVVCGGRLYIRHGDFLLAYDVRAK